MLTGGIIVVASFAYVGLLFAIAAYGDRRADAGRSLIANPYIYTLSLAVYCTSWTYYGSVGRAATGGIGFLAIYIGPTLMAALWWFLLLKMIRISKANRITSIADFVASRYGKSQLLGGLVTVIAVVGIIPYIALQLKAISTSFSIILHYPGVALPEKIGAQLFIVEVRRTVADDHAQPPVVGGHMKKLARDGDYARVDLDRHRAGLRQIVIDKLGDRSAAQT